MSDSEKINAVTRFSLYFGVALYFIKNKWDCFYIPLTVMGVIYFLYHMQTKDLIIEDVKDGDIQYGKNPHSFKESTRANPFMNLNLNEYGTTSGQKPALKGRRGQKKIRQHVNKIYSNVDELYDREMATRQFYTMPVTTVPNDRAKFARWCYEQKSHCKEKGVGCDVKW